MGGELRGKTVKNEVEGPESKGPGSELLLRKRRGWDGMEFPEVQVEGAWGCSCPGGSGGSRSCWAQLCGGTGKAPGTTHSPPSARSPHPGHEQSQNLSQGSHVRGITQRTGLEALITEGTRPGRTSHSIGAICTWSHIKGEGLGPSP